MLTEVCIDKYCKVWYNNKIMSMQSPNHSRAEIAFASGNVVSSVLVATGTADDVLAFHAGFSLGANQLPAVADTQTSVPSTQVYIPAYPTRELPVCDSRDNEEQLAHVSGHMTRFTMSALAATRQHLRYEGPIDSAPHSLATMAVFGGMDGHGKDAAITYMNGRAAIIAGVGLGKPLKPSEFALRCVGAAGAMAGGLATEFSKTKLAALLAGSGGLSRELSYGLTHTPQLVRLLGTVSRFDAAHTVHEYSALHRVDALLGQKDVLVTPQSVAWRRDTLRYGTGPSDYHVWQTNKGRHDFPAGDPTMLAAAFALLGGKTPPSFTEL